MDARKSLDYLGSILRYLNFLICWRVINFRLVTSSEATKRTAELKKMKLFYGAGVIMNESVII